MTLGCYSEVPQRYPGYSVSGIVLWEWRRQSIEQAIAHQIPPSEVDWLLQAVSPLERLTLRLESFQSMPDISLDIAFEELQQRWQQRIEERSPLQYLVGHTQWRQFQLTVSPAVLIPRPETEMLIDLAIAATATYPELRQGHWVDMGTGSGAIAMGLADAFPQALVHAVDCSAEALAIAQHNASQNSLERICFHQGHWFEPFQAPKHSNACVNSSSNINSDAELTSISPSSHSSRNARLSSPYLFSGIVSNPPYIPSSIVLTLQPEVSRHEPHLALDGGNDGLDCIRSLITTASNYLVPNGVLLLEMMEGQMDIVLALLEQQSDYNRLEAVKDLAGIQRFVQARYCP